MASEIGHVNKPLYVNTVLFKQPIIKQVTLFNSSLLLKIDLQNTQTLQLN